MYGGISLKFPTNIVRSVFVRVSLLIVLWIFLFPVYRSRVPAFGCFDDCFNYMGGYFLNSGKRLYSEIFYNHQPVMAYLSAAIQRIGAPDSLYGLILQHRMAGIGWAVLWDALLTVRFGWVGLGFSMFYEMTKGHVFGDRFLAEAFIVYPLVYLTGLVFAQRRKQRLSALEYAGAAAGAWFVIFSREPYVPLALVLFVLLWWPARRLRAGKLSAALFLTASAVTVLVHPVYDYFFQVVAVNAQTVAAGEIGQKNLLGAGIFNIVLYPAAVFFGGKWNLFRTIEIGVAVIFWSAFFLDSRKWKTKIPGTMVLFLILGLANIRPVPAGTIYYEAFQHLVGYGMLIAVTLFLLQSISGIFSGVKRFLVGLFALVVISALLFPQSYLHDRVDRNAEFTQNYSVYYVTGEVVKQLSAENDTLFPDGLDDLIYWQANRHSPYPFAWYTSVMHEFDVYKNARLAMFQNNPPDFYYGNCRDSELLTKLPSYAEDVYLRFLWQGKPTCLYVHREMYERISREKLEAVSQQFDYTIQLR